ncbi:CUE domain-containing protein [Cucumis melo var. makuwa]|uniref:CUE domain-containing protein n=1 Tax=Cucumis melo var. makuwa TaxID=1194695 RepID=A0A5D3E120_CUCMM|nr:CUE domain-containing protein [Cucumis melo var. makuwa]
MSAVVCGSKRSFFEELPPSPPIAKRHRCSTSPIRFAAPSHIDHLQHLFPQMDHQLLVRALEECGNDLDAAIRSLSDLCLGSAVENPVASAEPETNLDQGSIAKDGEAAVSENSSSTVSLDGRKWIDLFVGEMTNATTVADAKTRAARALEALENSITARVSVDAAQNFHKENMQLKEQIEVLLRENTILKRAVAIQHERQKEFEDKNLELQHLKQLLAQYQEQLRTLEINNYALTMHLKQAQQSSSIPGRFHPDVF